MIKKKFKTPLYGTEFTVIIYNNDDELQKEFGDYIFNPPIEQFDGGILHREDKLYLVLCSEKEGYPTPGIIAHEAKHLVNAIYIDICCELDKYNDEPECYLLSWIVNRIHEMIPKT